MDEKWKFYFCNVNDKAASICLNLALADEAPILAKPWLLWVWVYFRTPRPDGLSDSQEAPTLFKIEDALTLGIEKNCGAISCGRITTDGRREFYFYGNDSRGFQGAVRNAMDAFPEYKVDTGNQEDSGWNQYLRVLYPSDDELERIKNRDVIDVLEKNGDVHSVSREVSHWIFFPSEDLRTKFRQEVVNGGFRVVSEYVADGVNPFCIAIASVQDVMQETIDATVIQLCRLADEFQGEYDGWETQVVTQ